MNCGQAVTGIAVSKAILRPARKLGGFAHQVEFLALVCWYNRAGHFRVRS